VLLRQLEPEVMDTAIEAHDYDTMDHSHVNRIFADDFLAGFTQNEGFILDVGTGSGCIAVTLAHHLKQATVVAVDVSATAIEVAKRNSQKNKVADRIDFRLGDLYSPIKPGEQFDAIVSNPPYIRSEDLATLQADVRDHEPRSALDGGPDGFAVIDRLISGAASFLAPGGWLLFEIGKGQEESALAKLQAAGFKTEQPILDAAGIARVIVGRKA